MMFFGVPYPSTVRVRTLYIEQPVAAEPSETPELDWNPDVSSQGVQLTLSC